MLRALGDKSVNGLTRRWSGKAAVGDGNMAVNHTNMDNGACFW